MNNYSLDYLVMRMPGYSMIIATIIILGAIVALTIIWYKKVFVASSLPIIFLCLYPALGIAYGEYLGIDFSFLFSVFSDYTFYSFSTMVVSFLLNRRWLTERTDMLSFSLLSLSLSLGIGCGVAHRASECGNCLALGFRALVYALIGSFLAIIFFMLFQKREEEIER